ncbi:MAG: PDZ domain-containing protein [Cytophagales bacterium]|nr:PDZ domain-containing protein [Cytophagales bacterium]
MKRILILIFWIGVFAIDAHAFFLAAKGTLEYRISMPNPHTHYFEVEILLKNYDQNFVDFKMPVWTPGSYVVREFSKNVEAFKAFDADDGSPLEFRKINKNTWRVAHKKNDHISIQYKVYAFEGKVRMSFLDEDHAFIMANTLIMYVEDLMESSSVLHLSYPEDWKSVSTSLSKINGQQDTYYVPNYDILVDSPIGIGNHKIINFIAAEIPHEIAMIGHAEYNKDKLVRDLAKIVESSTSIFGENPNEKYTFIVHATGSRTGGLEHQSSTVLNVNRWTFSNTSSYNSFLALAAHEYIHLWIVKRLIPVELEKIDYDKEVYTDLLWVMEGFTSYFEEKVMLKCGFYSEEKFIHNMLSAMSKIRNTPGSKVQSVAESSFDAWIKFYRKNENSQNNQISYYTKGMVLAALLDIGIIAGSDGQYSLDDVMSQLYYQFYKKKGRGISGNDMKRALERAGGNDLSDFFEDYIYGTTDLDNEKYLHLAGLGLIETNGALNSKSIGVSLKQIGDRLIVNSVIRGGSADENGLNTGDELIAINNYRINTANYSVILNHFKIGDRIRMLISRDGLILEKELEVKKDDTVNYTYELLDNRTKQQEKVYKTWLGK